MSSRGNAAAAKVARLLILVFALAPAFPRLQLTAVRLKGCRFIIKNPERLYRSYACARDTVADFARSKPNGGVKKKTKQNKVDVYATTTQHDDV